MSPAGWTGEHHAFFTLRTLARKRSPAEVCDLCAAALAPGHQHLIDPATRKLHCACDACAVLFTGRTEGPYKRVPRRIHFLENFCMTDAQWESLRIPINVAFFFHSSPHSRVVALYPSPAGATESLLPLDTWDAIAEDNPILSAMEPDVEAFLANRLGRARGFPAHEHYLLPIDECYRLVGLIRARWRGFSGGAEVWEELVRFFASLKERANPAREESGCLT